MISGPTDPPSPIATIGAGQLWPPERRNAAERRHTDRRTPGALVLAVHAGGEQRGGAERRTRVERRGKETVEEHVRNALQLLVNIAETSSLDDEGRRDLDAAMIRLRYAVERLRRGAA